MKKAIIREPVITAVVIFLLCFAEGQITIASPNNILGLPFAENWKSGTFTLNDWQFPMGQVNWQISYNTGNPAPSAEFSGTPSVMHYNSALVSPWFKGQDYSCSDIWLSFDIRLLSSSNTGNEKMVVEYCFHDTTWYNLMDFRNTFSFSWTNYRIPLPHASSHYFKIRFRAAGINSSAISAWNIDNISVDYICRKADHVYGCEHSSTDLMISWDPVINYTGYYKDFILDDWQSETSLGCNDSPCWLGNKFLVDPWLDGKIIYFECIFDYNTTTTACLRLDVYDTNRNIVWSSPPFVPEAGENDIMADSLPLHGSFYAMVHWQVNPPKEVYMGYDTDGPYTSANPAWIFDGTSWKNISDYGFGKGAFTLRAHAWMTSQKKKSTIMPDTTVEHDPDNIKSMYVQGYDVYLSTNNSNGQYAKMNGAILHSNFFNQHTNICGGFNCWTYIVTTFRDKTTDTVICQSISDTAWVGVEGLSNNEHPANIKIWPNPASSIIFFHSDELIERIELFDIRGIKVKEVSARSLNEFNIKVDDLSPGVYLMKFQSRNESSICKLAIRQ